MQVCTPILQDKHFRLVIVAVLLSVAMLVLTPPAYAKEKTRIVGLRTSYTTYFTNKVVKARLERYHRHKWLGVAGAAVSTKAQYWNHAPSSKTDSKGYFKVDIGLLGDTGHCVASSKSTARLKSCRFRFQVTRTQLVMPARVSIPASTSVVATGGAWPWTRTWHANFANGSPALTGSILGRLGSVETRIVNADFWDPNYASGLILQVQKGGSWVPAEFPRFGSDEFYSDELQWNRSTSCVVANPDPANATGDIDPITGVPSSLPYVETDNFRLLRQQPIGSLLTLVKDHRFYNYQSGIIETFTVTYTITN
jgi:hypothetical protein